MNTREDRAGAYVLGAFIDAVDWTATIKTIATWASAGVSRYVCICNVHSVVTASRDRAFRDVLNAADMATPDGAPIAWMLRRLGYREQSRINGPDLMWRYLAEAEKSGQSVYFYGSTEPTLGKLRQAIAKAFPRLVIAGMCSPPFRELSAFEDAEQVAAINASSAGVVFVGLGCPKQEHWMASHRGAVQAVMIGVGAAFDYHAGTIRRAPLWMQQNGLEWLHRLLSEPRRLWRRYLSTNTAFIWRATVQLVAERARNRK